MVIIRASMQSGSNFIQAKIKDRGCAVLPHLVCICIKEMLDYLGFTALFTPWWQEPIASSDSVLIEQSQNSKKKPHWPGFFYL